MRTWLVALLLAGCSSGPSGSPIETVPPPSVTVTRPERRTVHRTMQTVGEVRGWQEARLVPRVSGYVSRILVDRGDHVQAGDLLAELSVPELEQEALEARARVGEEESLGEAYREDAATQSARARAAEAEIDRLRDRERASRSETAWLAQEVELQREAYRRLKEVADSEEGLVARLELEQALGRLRQAESTLQAGQSQARSAASEVRAAESQLQAARLAVASHRSRARGQEAAAEARRHEAAARAEILGLSQIRAPFTGIVIERMVDAGALVQHGPVLAIADIDRVRIRLPIPETEVAHVRPRFTVVRLEGLSERARVTRTSDALDVSTRTMMAEVELPNPRHRLKSGMALRASVELEERAGVLAVPTRAVLFEKKGPAVFVVRDGTAQKTPVKVGFLEPEWVEVVEGLQPHDAVVVEGNQDLKNGARVRVVEPSSRVQQPR
ncbi:MAG: efflux RND transporter periplasmic adaptor subunit [Candidatus Eremiobacterota bacterium]